MRKIKILRLFLISLFHFNTVKADQVHLCSSSNLTIIDIQARNFNFSLSLHEKDLNCSKTNLLNISLPLTEEGILILGDGSQYFSKDYCLVGLLEDNVVEIQACQRFSCGEGCIIKCCEAHEILSYGEEHGNLKCISNPNGTWNPVIYNNEEDNFSSFKDFNNSLKFLPSHPLKEGWCEFGPFILDSEEFEGAQYLIHILDNGSVKVKSGQLPWRVLEPGAFCVDGISRNGVIDTDHSLMVLDCSLPDESVEGVNQSVYIVFQAVACCFLLLTVFVYLILWEKQNIHGWTLLGYAISMLLLHLSIFAIYFHNNHFILDRLGDDWLCLSLALLSYFLYLMTFAWLSLINIDVWWTFSKMALTTGGSKRSRFFYYMAFSFLVPTAVILLGLVLKMIEYQFISNKFGPIFVYLELSSLHCYISDYSSFFFKLLPVAILLTCNLVLFIITVVTLYRINESTKFARNKSSKTDSEKSKFLLFVKLFFVMGLIWILDLVSFTVFGRGSTNPVAYALDIIVILQPVAIFIIFVCKADILRGLQLKLPIFRRIFQLLGLTQIPSRNGSGLSTASQATQMSICSNKSYTGSGAGNQVSFEMTGATP